MIFSDKKTSSLELLKMNGKRLIDAVEICCVKFQSKLVNDKDIFNRELTYVVFRGSLHT